MKNFFSKVRNEKGIAMLVALSAVIIMTMLAVEVGYNTSVELAIGVSQLDRLKAYYLAKSGVNLSLLRIKLFRTAAQKLGSSLGKNASMLDLIWNVPFMWPPQALGDMGAVDKAALKKTIAESYIDGTILCVIEAEGSRIDITDLISPSKSLQTATNNELVQVIQNRLDDDDTWARENRRNIKPQELVNNITDWMSATTNSLNGGDKNSGYSPPIKTPNRPIKTLEELHMIKGMTDEIYKLLADRVTLYGAKGINVNTAPKEVLRSIDIQISDKIADAIAERRSDLDKGLFQSTDDLNTFLQTQGVNMQTFNKTPVTPLYFEPEFNFRIHSTGIHGKSQREIFAITYDFDKVKEKLEAAIPQPSPSPSGTPQPTPGGTAGVTPAASASPSPSGSALPLPTGPPTIVFWQET